MVIRAFLHLFLACLTHISFAQTKTISSLRQEIEKVQADTTRLSLLNDLSLKYLRTNLDSAEYYANKAVKIATKIKQDRGIVRANKTLVIVRGAQGKYKEALDIIARSRELDITKQEEVMMLHLKGVILKRQRRYAETLKVFYRGLELAEYNKQDDEIWNIKMNLGTVYIHLREYEKARKIYEELEASPDAVKFPVKIKTVKFNIGWAYMEEKQFEKAMFHFNRSVKGLKDEDDPALMAVYHNNMAIVQNGLGHKEAGIKHAKKSIGIYKKIHSNSSLANSYNCISNIYETKKDYHEMYLYADSAYQIAKNTDLKRVKTNALNLLLRSKVHLGDTTQLLPFMEQVIAAKAESEQQKASQQLIEIKAKYETAQKEKLLVEKDSKLARQAMVRNILIVGTVILLFLLLFIYRNNCQKSKINRNLALKTKEIANQKQVIEQSLQEKETLLREIHHRVKNNLQVVSSLLNMQAQHTNNPSTATAMAEGQNRIKTMALIHQKLYQSEQCSAIDFKEYAEQLHKHLRVSMAGVAPNVQTKICADDIKLSIEEAMPIGLILNELISNAYKYAFGREGGVLLISLVRLDHGFLKLKVGDNGKGLPENFEIKKLNSLGMSLVQMLTEQLGGDLAIHDENGATFEVQFKGRIPVAKHGKTESLNC